MASLFSVFKTFRPRRTVLSDDFNTLLNNLKASFDSLGDAPAAGRKGVSTPFAVGTPTESYHAVDKATLDASPASADAAAASAAAALISENNAATSETNAANSVAFTWTPVFVGDADYAVSASAGGLEVYVELVTTARTVTLPASPTTGQRVKVIDLSWLAGSYNITVDPNGNDIHGDASNFVIDVDGAECYFIFDGTEWWFVGGER